VPTTYVFYASQGQYIFGAKVTCKTWGFCVPLKIGLV